MANRQIFELGSRSLSVEDVLPTQDATGASEAGQSTVQDIIDLTIVSPNFATALVDAQDDADAAQKGVTIGQLYRNGNFILVRLT